MGKQEEDCLSVEQQEIVVELWDKYSKLLFLYIYKLEGYREDRLEDTEDCFQDVFVRLMNKMIDGEIQLSRLGLSWFMTVARNIIIDKTRRIEALRIEPMIKEQEDGNYEYLDTAVEPVGTQNIEQKELMEKLKGSKEKIVKAMLDLPDAQRKVFMEYLKSKQAKKAMNFTNAQRKALSDARKNLKKALFEDFEGYLF